MSVLLSHPTGNANVRNTLRAFYEAGILGQFVTTVATFDDNLFGKVSSCKLGAELKRRGYDRCLQPYTRQYPGRELCRMLSAKLGLGLLSAKEGSPFSVQRIYEAIDRKAAQQLRADTNNKAVYAYEDGALHSFLAARSLGIASIYELPTAYWRTTRRIMREEAEREPEWAPTIPALSDSGEKLERKDRELENADHIIVPSRFCAESITSAKITSTVPVILPYGCPEPVEFSERQNKSKEGTLKLLFVGNLSQGKGLSYLFDAVDRLKGQVELSLIGKRVCACQKMDRELERHNWLGTMPHSQVLETMREYNLLVFPSLLEGFGMVITEALSQGLPVITTPHTCAAEMIADGEAGFIVPIRDAETIARRISQLCDDRGRLVAMKHAAIETARRNTWTQYRENVAQLVGSILSAR